MFRSHSPKTPVLLLAALLIAAPAFAQTPRLDTTTEDGRLRIALDGPAVSWETAGLTRLAVRSATGLEHLAPRLDAAQRQGRELDVDLPDGCAVVFLETRERALKLITCDAQATFADRLGVAATAKVGGSAEIRPLSNPALITAGSDLVFRVYLHNAAWAGARVTATGPNGALHTATTLSATTDRWGHASMTIDRPGVWTVLTEPKAGQPRAELRFDALPADEWEGRSLMRAPPKRAVTHNVDTPRSLEEWRELGPSPLVAGPGARNAGRAAGIALSPDRRNRYYVGAASGGVWESTNGGLSWTSLSDSLPTLAIGAIALDPRNDQVIYAGSGEANYSYHSLYGLGLYRSFDRGRTWRVLAPDIFRGRTFSRLVVSPHDNRIVWAAVARAGGTFEGFEGARNHPDRAGPMGIFRSHDRGETWTHLRAGHGLPAFEASDVDLDATDAQRIYVSAGDVFAKSRNGVYRSTDGGSTFEPSLVAHEIDRTFGRVTMTIAPSDPNRLYALVVNPAIKDTTGGFSPSGARTEALYRSDDGGDSWTRFSVTNFQGQQGQYNTTLTVAPDDPDTVFLGGVQMLRSRDGGSSFQDVTPIHVDAHDMSFDAIGRLVVANDGGVNRSSDLGNTWETRNEGLATVQIYPGLALHPTDPEVVLAGMQDNGTNLRTENSSTWLSIFGGDGGYCLIHPDNPNIVFVQFQGTGNLFRSTNGGITFQEISAGINSNDRTAFQGPLTFDPSNPDRILYATQRVYESIDGGSTWNAISGDLTAGEPAAIRSLVLSPSNPNVAWASTNDGRVLVSTTSGSDWELVRTGVGGWPRIMRQIAVDPERPAQAYVADMRFGGAKVLVTVDRGATWQSLGAGLANMPVNTVAIHRVGSTRYIFAGTDRGVFLKTNFGGAWEEYGELQHAPVMDLVVDTRFNRLVAATLGRGAFEIALP